MGSVRINISLPEEIFNDIKEQRLAAEYLEASADIRRINQELECVISDGLN